MSGLYFYLRKFFVIKASFVFANVNKKNFDTFGIFFQRYSNNKSLWKIFNEYIKRFINRTIRINL